jgi:hypothetical protein
MAIIKMTKKNNEQPVPRPYSPKPDEGQIG